MTNYLTCFPTLEKRCFYKCMNICLIASSNKILFSIQLYKCKYWMVNKKKLQWFVKWFRSKQITYVFFTQPKIKIS